MLNANYNNQSVKELTARGMILGAVLTVIFTASNLYLGLKVGLTFSSAIPAAVISMAVLKWAKDSSILENNMVQTQASAAGTLAGIIFIIPALLMIGYWHGFNFWQTLVISACGGCIGVLVTIPLRRAMVVHSDLPYPEGRAAAEILKVGCNDKKQSSNIKEILSGALLSGASAFTASGLNISSSAFSLWGAFGKGVSQLTIGYSPALLGAGYIIGLSAGIATLVGIVLAWGVFVPYFTWGVTGSETEIFNAAQAAFRDKIRLVGVGVMGIAAVWTVISLARPVIDGVKEAFTRVSLKENSNNVHHTDMDMSLKSVGYVFAIAAVLLLTVFYSFVHNANLPVYQEIAITFVGLVVAIGMGFLVAAACAYMAGLVGTSTTPISGIGIIGIIISSVVIMVIANFFGIFELPGGEQFVTATAIFTTSIIISIACISNDNMQDLKTGQIVGATPKHQQIALILGCVVGAFVIAPVLNLLYQAYGFVGAMPRAGMDEGAALIAPQASLMTVIVKGIISHNLHWDYILLGIGVGVVVIAIDTLLKKSGKNLALPPLAVGIGIYLPPNVNAPIVIGAIMGYIIRKILSKREKSDMEKAENRGTLFASGLIVGESLTGVLMAGIIVLSVANGGSDSPLKIDGFTAYEDILGLAIFVGIIALFIRTVMKR